MARQPWERADENMRVGRYFDNPDLQNRRLRKVLDAKPLERRKMERLKQDAVQEATRRSMDHVMRLEAQRAANAAIASGSAFAHLGITPQQPQQQALPMMGGGMPPRLGYQRSRSRSRSRSPPRNQQWDDRRRSRSPPRRRR